MIILLDFDDTLSEYTVFYKQYTQVLGGILRKSFGGEQEVWAHSAQLMLVAIEADYMSRFLHNPLAGYCAWLKHSRHLAAQILFEGAEMEAPANAVQYLKRAHAKALSQCSALFAGMEVAIHRLADAGIALYTASGNESRHLHAALQNTSLLNCFQRLYGPDLIDCAKEGPEYYTLICKDLHISPNMALVVDNAPEALGWAAEAGLNTLHIHLLNHLPLPDGCKLDTTITHPNDLLQALQSYTAVVTDEKVLKLHRSDASG